MPIERDTLAAIAVGLFIVLLITRNIVFGIIDARRDQRRWIAEEERIKRILEGEE